MFKTIRGIAVTLLLFTLFYTADSQTDNYYFYNDYESWEGGLSIGVNSFYGDVNDNTNKIFPANISPLSPKTNKTSGRSFKKHCTHCLIISLTPKAMVEPVCGNSS